ncbi:MAG: DUF2182 domain-containing protein [Opitutaceae bacterium]
MARDMYGDMTGASAWMMTDKRDVTHLVLLFIMWVVMMAGMMLPSAIPVVLQYAQVIRGGPNSDRVPAHLYAFAGGYLLIWTAFSLAATIVQRLLAHLLVLTPMMEPSSPVFGGALLITAGIFQFTPMKRSCLEHCRSPARFITEHIRPGVSGALRLGVDHGLHCLGCCWALMLLLFVGGVMNLWCILALTIVVLLEKVALFGLQGSRILGALVIALGVWVLFR